ncbi:MAG: metallophosphoesterase family protein [Kiritimatiellae bacterium]|nr:metallophosphoesterase family protein [Kiritimatiellia bacterium]MDD5520710.1 metallophosphoesterase family protein [Kiritimatiellia bacterium]
MRYALVSDIHANLQAWNAVLLDIRSLGADQIICLGDIVGYGPNPSEVLQSVHSSIDHIILGNHDAVACGKIDSSEFYDEAQKIINWTINQINDKAKNFLRSLPLTLAGESFRCSHGDFSDPGAFNYIIEPKEALASWKAVPDQLLFVGHTHEPTIHLLGQSGTPHLVKPQNFQIEPEKRYIVNVGSVGQPRDKDARSCYCIYDTKNNLVIWRRVPFDIDAFRTALHDAGISEKSSHFLRRDPRKDMPPIREMINFTPAVTPDKAVKDTVQVQQLKILKRNIKMWKILAVLALVTGITAVSFFGYSWWKYKNRSIVILDPISTVINSNTYTANTNMLTFPSATTTGNGIPGWNIKLGDKTQQSIKYEINHPDGRIFTLSSKTRINEINLISCSVKANAHKKMCFEALFRKAPSFSGTVAAVISVIRKNNDKEELIDPYVTKAPTQIRQGGWVMAKQTFELPANTVSLRLHIRGTFTGEVLLKNISLENKE